MDECYEVLDSMDGYRGSYTSIQEVYIMESDAFRQLGKLVQKRHPRCNLLQRTTFEIVAVGSD